MSKIVIMGAGFAGHTAALYLGDALGKEHEITVVNKFDYFLFVPSLVWVGVNHMKHEKTHFPLKPVYDKFNIHFEHASVTSIHPDDQFVKAIRHSDRSEIRLNYDYLINATGPKLNFEGTPGLGPKHGNSYSICNVAHTIETAKKYAEMVQRMQKGEKVKIVLGTGHPGATCQGAAFEYISNIHKDLDKKKIRDKAELLWLSNEPALGDFGVRGVHVRQKGKITGSEDFITEIFKQFNIQYEVQKGVASIDDKHIYWEDYEGKQGQTSYDFAMLIPQFLGMPMNYIGKNGEDVSSKIVNKAGLTLVDGIYGLPYNELVETPDAWPAVYQNPNYQNIFAAGIAFAPPGPISRPHTNPNGMVIAPAPPRTGMVSGIIGRVVAKNIISLIQKGKLAHSERMTEMFAACIASMGDSLWDGSAATIVIHPVVPDNKSYPNEMGRDLFVTHMEMGLAGAWMKRMIHTTFMWKLKGLPGWKIIPE
jgi:sulfide:quinone oxidoreductase